MGIPNDRAKFQNWFMSIFGEWTDLIDAGMTCKRSMEVIMSADSLPQDNLQMIWMDFMYMH